MQMTPPLAHRTVTELQAKAAELLSMSETARTADTRDALRRLALRFARLAESRITGQMQCANKGAWILLHPSDTVANP